MKLRVTMARQIILHLLVAAAFNGMIPQTIMAQNIAYLQRGDLSRDPPGVSRIDFGGRNGWFPFREERGVTLRSGWRGGDDILLSDRRHTVSEQTDLVVNFDGSLHDVSGRYDLRDIQGVEYHGDMSRFGEGSAAFDGAATFSLAPREGSIFSAYTHPGSFVMDVWIYPTHIADGADIFRWNGALVNTTHPVVQEVRFGTEAGRLQWALRNVVIQEREKGSLRNVSDVVLTARRPPIPQRWTHHRLRYDAERSQLTYLVDGIPEATTFLTDTGREGGSPNALLFGSDTGEGIVVGRNYYGLIDAIHFERNAAYPVYTERYTGTPGEFISAPIPLGDGGGRLYAIDTHYETPGNTDVRLYYRVGDSFSQQPWQPVPVDGKIPQGAGGDEQRGRYVQLRGLLLSDAAGAVSPRIREIEILYRPFPTPPSPNNVRGRSINGGVELHWDAVHSDTAERYRVFLGERPGRYLGTDNVVSPVSVEEGTSVTITGLEPDRSYVFTVESVDRYGRSSVPSPEIEIRAGRSGE